MGHHNAIERYVPGLSLHARSVGDRMNACRRRQESTWNMDVLGTASGTGAGGSSDQEAAKSHGDTEEVETLHESHAFQEVRAPVLRKDGEDALVPAH